MDARTYVRPSRVVPVRRVSGRGGWVTIPNGRKRSIAPAD